MSDELPSGWTVARIADVTQRVPNIKPESEPKKVFGYVDISSIDNSSFTITEIKNIVGKKAPSRARRPVKPKDTLFSNVRTYLRNIALVPEGSSAEVCSTGFTVLRPNKAVDPGYLFRYVLTDAFLDRVTPKQTGTHYPATSDRVVMAEEIPLAPIAEQRRIVAKLEQLEGKLGGCHKRLANISAVLTRFRHSVLAAACSARLTADWRAQNPSHACEEIVNDLPAGWKPISVGDVIDSLKYGTAQKCGYEKRGVPVLRIPNVANGTVDHTDLKYAQLPVTELKQLRLLPGDILLVRSNGSVSLVGKTALVRGAEKGFAYAGYLIRLRPKRTVVTSEFLNLVLGSFDIRLQIELEARSTSGVNNINGGEVRALNFFLPPLAEQREIVRRVDGLFALADQIERRLAKARAQVDQLMPSLLSKAFRGELVPTEAELARQERRDYESASVLLERLQRERNGGRSATKDEHAVSKTKRRVTQQRTRMTSARRRGLVREGLSKKSPENTR